MRVKLIPLIRKSVAQSSDLTHTKCIFFFGAGQNKCYKSKPKTRHDVELQNQQGFDV